MPPPSVGRVYADAALVLVVIQHETGWRFWRGIAVENEPQAALEWRYCLDFLSFNGFPFLVVLFH